MWGLQYSRREKKQNSPTAMGAGVSGTGDSSIHDAAKD
jgi:hypothetical protein